MDGRGGALVAWSEGDDLIRTRIYVPAQGWLPPLAPISAAEEGLYDVAMRPNQAFVLYSDAAFNLVVAHSKATSGVRQSAWYPTLEAVSACRGSRFTAMRLSAARWSSGLSPTASISIASR